MPRKNKKIKFLEGLLELAETHPELVDGRKTIFYYDGPFDQTCRISINLDNIGEPYFTCEGDGVSGYGEIKNPKELIEITHDYLPIKTKRFKEQFHFYEGKTIGCRDLAEKLR